MKLTCPTCHARYSIDDDKVTGKRVRIRCRACATVFVATAPLPAPEPARDARPGARHEESVLFSLQSLRRTSEESAPSPEKADGSGLIDIRRLAASMATTTPPRADMDAILHLGTGSVFAPSPVIPASPPSGAWVAPPRPVRGRSRVAVGAFVALAIAFAATGRRGLTGHTPTAASSTALARAAPPATVGVEPATTPPAIPPASERVPPVVAAAPPTSSVLRRPATPVPASPKPFDAASASKALGGVDLRSCTLVGGPPFEGHARVTLDPSGAVSSAVVDSPELAGTATERCVVGAYRRVRVPAFSGPPLTVGKRFVVMGS